MAYIETRNLAKGRKSYLVRWREPGDLKKLQRTFHRYEDARSFKTEIERQLDVGEYVTKDARSVPLGRYAREVLSGDWGLRDSTRYSYEHCMKKWISPTLGHRPLGELTTSELRNYFGAIDASDHVKRSVYRLLAKVLNQAVQDGLLIKSPLKPIQRPPVKPKDIRPLDPAVVRYIADHAEPRYRVPILLGGFAGLRAGEIGGLTLHDVDLAEGTLTIRQAVRQVGPQRVLGEVKTDSSRRKVRVPLFLLEAVSKHLECFDPAPDGRIFTTGQGGLVSHTVLLKRLKAACRAAGEPEMRFHDLRHTCAALLIREGAHPKMIQAYLGHSAISVTLDLYGHLFPSVADQLAEKLNRVWQETSS